MTLTINNFIVTNTTTGNIAQIGRTTETDLQVILTQNIIMNDLNSTTQVPGTPSYISSGILYNVGHMNTSFIQIINVNQIINIDDCLYVSDAFIRFTFLGGITSNADSLIYAFANNKDTDITTINFNVIIANSNTQTIGDYFDIPIPDNIFYPNLYLVLCVLNGAWTNRTIVSGYSCSISSAGALTYCINNTKNLSDSTKSHFILVNGINTVYGTNSRISISCDDALLSSTNMYNSFKFSLSSRVYNETKINDTNVDIPVCYVEGTKILCFIDEKEQYISIENITKDMFVKTLNNGYKKVIQYIKSYIINDVLNLLNRIYVLKKEKNSNLIDDLYVTGGHSILVDKYIDNQEKETIKLMGDDNFMIQDKYRLLACLNDDFIGLNNNIRYNIYHISVGEQDIIYANGILSETFNIKWYNHIKYND
jgi:hypothetical protein